MSITDAHEKRVDSPILLYYLGFTAVTCGALVMVIEVLGSRVIGPFFGVSLFVWTSLITVTLIALALGYAVGGIVSDRRDSADYLYSVIFVAGLLILAIPFAKSHVLKVCLPLGLRMGALASSFLLFGPSLFLLGCVSPYIIKIAAREMKNIGRTVGLFYAISTMGSFIGTVATGFVLIAYLGVDRIFEATGMLLLGVALGYFLLLKKRWYLSLIVIFMIAVWLYQPDPVVSKTMQNGTQVAKIFAKDSFYGNLKVIDYSFGPVHTRELIIDGLVQGGIDMNSRLSIYEYPYFLEFIPYSLNPSGGNCLVIGLGAGVVPQWYENRGIRTDVVDIDPEVADIARKYFGFSLAGDLIISDARYYLINSEKKYDYVVLDVFNGDTTPGHVLSLEAVQLLSNRMTERGILAINLVGSLKEDTFITASVVHTLTRVFQTVEIHPTFSPQEGRGCGNIVLVAYRSPTMKRNVKTCSTFPVNEMAREGVNRYIDSIFRFPAETPAIVLSDDYNPIDFYDRRLKEHVREEIIKSTDWEILI